jgi:hypothetical protein
MMPLPADPAPFDRESLLSLAGDHLLGTASHRDVARLEAMLASSAAARERYLALALVHAQLAASPATLAAPGAPSTAATATRSAAPSRPAIRDPAVTLHRRHPIATAIVAVASVAVLLLLGLERLLPRATPGDAYYPLRHLPLSTVAVLETPADVAASHPLGPSTLRPHDATRLRAIGGADVQLERDSVFGIVTADGGTLYEGSVQARVTAPAASFSVTSANLRIVDRGTAFRVDHIDGDAVAVTVLEGAVEVQSRVRLPVAWWPFDSAPAATGTIRDVVRGLPGTLGAGVQPCAGLVGRGGLRFDGESAAHVEIAGGTGDAVGTGALAAADGITIEAVIAPEWTGRELDYDEIYRKDDGDYRVLLSFQNDGLRNEAFTDPPVAAGPCLSFGLHLAGIGYRELDMPLDGRDGRPTLAALIDGRPHHVVAAYDSFTGAKAIFVDGVRRFGRAYPAGSLVLAGGPARPWIGSHRGRENFRGVIDDVAIYDFALTPDEVAEHWRRARTGEPVFGGTPPASDRLRWRMVTRIEAGQTMTFDRRTGLAH